MSRQEDTKWLAIFTGLLALIFLSLSFAGGVLWMPLWLQILLWAAAGLMALICVCAIETLATNSKNPEYPSQIIDEGGNWGPKDDKVWIYWLPGVGTSGLITSQYYVRFFARFGRLKVVEYAKRGFSMDWLVRHIVNEILAGRPEKVVFYGISLGGDVAIRVEYELELLGLIELARNVFVCTPPDGSYVGFPIRWTELINGHIAGFIYKQTVVRFSFYMPWLRQKLSPGVSKAEVKPHKRFRKKCNGRAQLQQIKAISEMRHLPRLTFQVPTRIFRTAKKDVLIKSKESADELHGRYPNSPPPTEMTGDKHAGVKELAPEYLEEFEIAMKELLAA